MYSVYRYVFIRYYISYSKCGALCRVSRIVADYGMGTPRVIVLIDLFVVFFYLFFQI